MNRAPQSVLAAASLLLGATALAQTPSKPPPWWGVNDENTVSLYWSFDIPSANPNTIGPPTSAVVPSWYSPAITVGTRTSNVSHLASFQNHVGVYALVGGGAPQAAAIALTVDNNPYPDWVKIFSVQFDAYDAAGAGSVVAAIKESLNYKRAIVSERSEALANGWQRITIDAQLIPQPDDEEVDWTMITQAVTTVAIDNLYVSSKCVKPMPDESGDALGAIGTQQNLSATTTQSDYSGVAVTEGPPPAFQRTYWAARRASTAGQQHQLVRFAGPLGTLVLAASQPLGSTLAQSPLGPGDLAVESVVVGGIALTQIVWTVLDERSAATPNQVRLLGVDATTGVSSSITLQFPPVAVVPNNLHTFGLAFDPSGQLGAGTFWISSTDTGGVGAMREFSRAGALLEIHQIEPGCTGLAYDDALGNFYGFSRAAQPSPSGPVQVNGFELSGYDFTRTGVRFCGNLNVPNRGGIASGLEVYRRHSPLTTRAPLTLACLVDNTANQQVAYELAGPFAFGWSRLGRCGITDNGPFRGLPFVGSTIEVTLSGVPRSPFAMLWLGFSNTTSPIGNLPIELGTLLGWQESVLSISPDVNTGLLTPSSPGQYVLPINIPNNAALGYSSVFFQWMALDSGVPGFFAMSQAGKTVIYP